jgi:hypothetical protein
VNSVWHVAHISDSRRCGAAVGWNVVADCMMRACPAAISYGPNARGSPWSTTNPPVKLSRVPRRAGVIWWHTVQDAPSRASREMSVVAGPGARFANTSGWPPVDRCHTFAIGMWQMEHSASMAAAASG